MSVLDDVLKKHRKRIVTREEATFREMLRAYEDVERELRRQIRELEKKVKAAKEKGEEISPSWFSREKRLQTLLDQVKTEIIRFGQTAAPIIEREQRAAIDIAVSQTNEILLTVGSDKTSIGGLLPKRTVENAVGFMGDGSPLLNYFEENLAPAVAAKLRSEIIKAAALGTDFNTIARRLRQAGDITRSRALSTARTEVNRVRRETTRQIYQENSDIITGWEWVAAKSSRTCPACLALDGRIFKLNVAFPQHVNCRCTMIPVIEGVTRPPRTLGEDWFERQSNDTKQQILGKEAFAAYKDGQVRLNDFVGYATSKEFGKRVYTRSLSDALLKKAEQQVGPTIGANVVYNGDAKQNLKRMLGRRFSDQDVATMAGALDNSTVRVYDRGNAIFFDVEHPLIKRQERYLQKDADGDLYFHNDYFMKRGKNAPAGLAKISFPRQALKAKELGVKYIKTFAAGDYFSAQHGGWNGYITWARFGYNGSLTAEERKFYRKDLDTKRRIYDINDVMLAGGKDAWLVHGSGRNMIFWLDGRAKSMKILRSYLREFIDANKK